jgi:hypothetical protein
MGVARSDLRCSVSHWGDDEMNDIEYRTVDKSEWERGPWDNEPDKIQWTDEATGLPCLIVRGPSGALCGYAGVAEGHPLFGVDYNEFEADVHWGLTFSDHCQPHSDDESRGICHVPAPGEPDHVWWFGFDCAHSGDYCPAHSKRNEAIFKRRWDKRYQGIGYVRSHVRSLAQQLAERVGA